MPNREPWMNANATKKAVRKFDANGNSMSWRSAWSSPLIPGKPNKSIVIYDVMLVAADDFVRGSWNNQTMSPECSGCDPAFGPIFCGRVSCKLGTKMRSGHKWEASHLEVNGVSVIDCIDISGVPSADNANHIGNVGGWCWGWTHPSYSVNHGYPNKDGPFGAFDGLPLPLIKTYEWWVNIHHHWGERNITSWKGGLPVPEGESIFAGDFMSGYGDEYVIPAGENGAGNPDTVVSTLPCTITITYEYRDPWKFGPQCEPNWNGLGAVGDYHKTTWASCEAANGVCDDFTDGIIVKWKDKCYRCIDEVAANSGGNDGFGQEPPASAEEIGKEKNDILGLEKDPPVLAPALRGWKVCGWLEGCKTSGALHGVNIITHPVDRTVSAGSETTFTVVAEGAGALTYQWHIQVGIATTDIAGATSDTYTIPNAELLGNGSPEHQAGSYSVTVTNEVGSVTSNAAILTVTAQHTRFYFKGGDDPNVAGNRYFSSLFEGTGNKADGSSNVTHQVTVVAEGNANGTHTLVIGLYGTQSNVTPNEICAIPLTAEHDPAAEQYGDYLPSGNWTNYTLNSGISAGLLTFGPGVHEQTIDILIVPGPHTIIPPATTLDNSVDFPDGDKAFGVVIHSPIITDNTGAAGATASLEPDPAEFNHSDGTGGGVIINGHLVVIVNDDPSTCNLRWHNEGEDLSGFKLADGSDGPVAAPAWDIIEGTDAASQTVSIYVVKEDANSNEETTVEVNFVGLGGGSATEGVDYTATGGFDQQVIFSGTTTLVKVEFDVHADSIGEGNETIHIKLQNAVQTGMGISKDLLPNAATITGLVTKIFEIIDDDTSIEFASSASTVPAEGDSGTTTPHLVTVNRVGLTVGEATVEWAITGVTATAAEDYTEQGGTLTFGDGSDSEDISISIIGDNDIEDDETFTITLSNAQNDPQYTPVSLGAQDSHTVTITDDDDGAYFKFTSGTSSRPELNVTNTIHEVTVERRGNMSGMAEVDWDVTGGTATADEDYGSAATTGQTLTFVTPTAEEIEAKVQVGIIFITVLGDTDIEGNETIEITLSNPTHAAQDPAVDPPVIIDPNPHIVTIIGDDTTEIRFASATSTVPFEGQSAPTTHLITVQRVYAGTNTLCDTGMATVDYETLSGDSGAPAFDAISGTDFEYKIGTLTIPDGQSSGTISVVIKEDRINENDEEFRVILTNPVLFPLGYQPHEGPVILANGLPSATHTVTITDDDTTHIDFTWETSSLYEPGASGSVVHQVPVRRVGPLFDPLTNGTASIAWETVDDTATAGVDYVAANGTLTIPHGQDSADIEITINGNETVDGDKTFKIKLKEPATAEFGAAVKGYGTYVDHVVTILDDDSSIQFALNTSAVIEGDSGTTTHNVRVTRTGNLVGIVNFQYTMREPVNTESTNDSAELGVDYTHPYGALPASGMIGTGLAFVDIPISIVGDTDVENDEDIVVEIYNPTIGTGFWVNGTVSLGAAGQGFGTLPDASLPQDRLIHVVTITDDDTTTTAAGTTTTEAGTYLRLENCGTVNEFIVTDNGSMATMGDFAMWQCLNAGSGCIYEDYYCGEIIAVNVAAGTTDGEITQVEDDLGNAYLDCTECEADIGGGGGTYYRVQTCGAPESYIVDDPSNTYPGVGPTSVVFWTNSSTMEEFCGTVIAENVSGVAEGEIQGTHDSANSALFTCTTCCDDNGSAGGCGGPPPP